MSASAVARNYAGTLLELAERDGSEEAYGERLAEIAGLYGGDPEFHAFLNAPSISPEEKKRVVRAALHDAAPEPFVRFLMVVLDRRRHRSLPGMAEAYRELLDERAGRVRATITLAHEADEALREQIVGALEGRFEGELVPEFRTDDRLLGGLIVRVGDALLDASVRSRLKDLGRELA